MRIFQLEIEKLTLLLIPTFLRKAKLVGLMRILVAPIGRLHYDFTLREPPTFANCRSTDRYVTYARHLMILLTQFLGVSVSLKVASTKANTSIPKPSASLSS